MSAKTTHSEVRRNQHHAIRGEVLVGRVVRDDSRFVALTNVTWGLVADRLQPRKEGIVICRELEWQ